jgi:guanine deaminase
MEDETRTLYAKTEKQRMSAPHERWMRRAIELATQNVVTLAGGPFGAVITREGHLVAEGANRVTRDNDPTAHAEVVAIRAAAQALGTFDLAGTTLYTSCEPCPMCLAAAYWARVDHIFFGNTAADAAEAGFRDDLLYRELREPHGRRSIPITPLLGDEAAASFEAWRQSPLRIDY